MLTEQELERIEALGARWMTEEYLIALIASHREQGALIRELAEALRGEIGPSRSDCNERRCGACSRCRSMAALSKVPR
jgi:hypothetical protein